MIPNKRTIKIDTKPKIISDSPEFTFEFGKKLASALKPKDIIAIYGNLGAGKTCLVQGICAGLNVSEYVNSPSFTIINEYEGNFPIYHFDFYRLGDPEELEYLGIRDYLEENMIALIEWPEKGGTFTPTPNIQIQLFHHGEARLLIIN